MNLKNMKKKLLLKGKINVKQHLELLLNSLFIVFRLRPRKIKPAEPEKPQKKKLDTSKTPDDKTKATESGTETPSKPTLPCKIPIPVGMELPLPFQYQDKVRYFYLTGC